MAKGHLLTKSQDSKYQYKKLNFLIIKLITNNKIRISNDKSTYCAHSLPLILNICC